MNNKNIYKLNFNRLDNEESSNVDLVNKCAFLLIYCDDGIPYSKYTFDNSRNKIPVVLSLVRHDGFYGFIGGKIEHEEEVIDGLLREVKEETSLILDKSSIEPLTTIYFNDSEIHSFKMKVSYEKLLDMSKEIANSERFGTEIIGYSLNHIETYIDGGINVTFSQKWKATSKLELIELIKQENLLNDIEKSSYDVI